MNILGHRYLNETAVYWERTGNNRQFQPEYAAPVEVYCRWEDVAEEYMTPDGRKLISKSWILIGAEVDGDPDLGVDLKVGGALLLGTIAGLTYPTQPMRNTGAHEIMQFLKTPNKKATKFLREAIL